MSRCAYITILGRSTWALVNTYYAVLRERGEKPDVIYVFTEKIYEKDLDKTISALKTINREFGFAPGIERRVIRDIDFATAGKMIYELVSDLKSDGYEVSIDITPGRRALVAAATLTATKVDVKHLFYLGITTTDDAAKPYLMIPLKIQKLRCFMEDARKVVT